MSNKIDKWENITWEQAGTDRCAPGWYYDNQKELDSGRLTAISLHANAVYTTRKRVRSGMKYSEFSTDTPEDKYSLYKFYPWGNTERDEETTVEVTSRNEKPNSGYFKEPLCTGVVNEDFVVNIQNAWTQIGDDPLSGLWNQVKQIGSYLPAIISDTGAIVEETFSRIPEDLLGSDNVVGNAFNKLMRGVDIAAKFAQKDSVLDTISDYTNRSLAMQGTRFSYYQGTSVNFTNLNVKFTLFPKYRYIIDESGEGHWGFVPVTSQLRDLFPYFFGEYITEDLATVLKRGLEDFVGWQLPPGGYRASIKDVDSTQRGTLKLKIGSLYSISNLVAENCSFNFSKETVKCPCPHMIEDNTSPVKVEGLISPLSCDINLSLRPVTQFSSQTFRKFIDGDFIKSDRDKLSSKIVEDLKRGNDFMREKYKDKNIGQDPDPISETERKMSELETAPPPIAPPPIINEGCEGEEYIPTFEDINVGVLPTLPDQLPPDNYL